MGGGKGRGALIRGGGGANSKIYGMKEQGWLRMEKVNTDSLQSNELERFMLNFSRCTNGVAALQFIQMY